MTIKSFVDHNDRILKLQHALEEAQIIIEKMEHNVDTLQQMIERESAKITESIKSLNKEREVTHEIQEADVSDDDRK